LGLLATSIDPKLVKYQKKNPFKQEFLFMFFIYHYEVGQTLEQIMQKGCGVSILGDIQKQTLKWSWASC